MSLIQSPGDHPDDVLHRAAAVVAFLAETMVDARAPGQDLTLSEQALHGLSLITHELRADLERAAGS